jgi:N-acetylneuraminic acid mutarotase
MVIFGGFENGSRTNTLAIYDILKNTWQKLDTEGLEIKPEQRSGHSAIIKDDKLYVFGGKNEENNKLSDFWAFDLKEQKWTEIKTEISP